jgi:hypothetical protein
MGQSAPKVRGGNSWDNVRSVVVRREQAEQRAAERGKQSRTGTLYGREESSLCENQTERERYAANKAEKLAAWKPKRKRRELNLFR